MKKKYTWVSIAVVVVTVLAFHVYSQDKGYIEIDTAGVEMQLRSGWFSGTRITSAQEPVAVSARAYRPRQLSITRRQGGNTWQIDGFGPWGNLAKIRVKSNETTLLKLGPPFLIESSVLQRSSLVSIGLSIIGQAGEHYHAAVMKNGRRLAAPRLAIVDEAGKVLASGKFEYG